MSWLRFSNRSADRVPFHDDEHPVLSDPEDEDVMDYPLHDGFSPTVVTQEHGWRRFVQCVMASAVRHMEFLRSADMRSLRSGVEPRSEACRERLRSSLSSYAWVYHHTGDSFQFNRVCESVGLDPELVQEKMAAVCPEAGDINEVVGLYLAGKLL
jgi:hypothetical protein